MKIHRLGNDYAFQRKQKSTEKKQADEKPNVHQSVEPLAEQKVNVENQISGLGEGNLGNEAQGEESKQEKEVRKKKKETGSKAQQEDGQV